MKNRLIVFLGLCLLAACQNTPSETGQRQELEAHVLRVHDEAMAKMDQLFILRQDLKKLRDSLQTHQTDTATRHRVNQHLALLQKADDAMMQWMHRYKAPAKEQAHDSTMQYLQGQLQKIEQVKKTMDSTLAAAQHIYQQYEPKK
jgi:hypothetical protein